MKVETVLEDARRNCRYIDSMIAQVNLWHGYSIAVPRDTTISEFVHSRSQSLLKSLNGLLHLRVLAEDIIDSCPNDGWREVLEQYVLCGLDFDDIAENMDDSEDFLRACYDAAMRYLEKQWVIDEEDCPFYDDCYEDDYDADEE